jgi:hypothetical protein
VPGPRGRSESHATTFDCGCDRPAHGSAEKMIRPCHPPISLTLYRLAPLLLVLLACAPHAALSQTPSPLQEWQYPGGITLSKLFQPKVPKWSVVAGAALITLPRYDGAFTYHAQPGPVIDIRYHDIAFASVGEGLGVNLLRGSSYRAGVAIGYDLGRKESDYPSHLRGLGDIPAATVIKVFGSYAISKEVPRAWSCWRVRRSRSPIDSICKGPSEYPGPKP